MKHGCARSVSDANSWAIDLTKNLCFSPVAFRQAQRLLLHRHQEKLAVITCDFLHFVAFD
jgi:hypothetical protein